MAEHERYRHRRLAGCACMGAAVYRLMGESAYVVSHEAEQVTYACDECGEVVGVFYRIPELEQERVKADKALLGKVIKADRFVAWVGYAKNPSTVVISENELRERARQLSQSVSGDNQVSGGYVGGNGDVVHVARSQECLNIWIMGVLVQRIHQEENTIYLALGHTGCNLGVPTVWPGSQPLHLQSDLFL